jgi:hypothetical protein
VLLPVVVNGVDDDVALERTERLGNLDGFLHGIGLLDALDDDARQRLDVVARELRDVEADREMRIDPADERLDVGLRPAPPLPPKPATPGG